MALTVTPKKVFVIGDRKEAHYDVTFDNSYPTGGETLGPTELQLDSVDIIEAGPIARNAAGTSAVPVGYDYTNSKLQAYRYDGASAGKAFLEEVANTVDLSTFTVRIRAVGRGPVNTP